MPPRLARFVRPVLTGSLLAIMQAVIVPGWIGSVVGGRKEWGNEGSDSELRKGGLVRRGEAKDVGEGVEGLILYRPSASQIK